MGGVLLQCARMPSGTLWEPATVHIGFVLRAPARPPEGRAPDRSANDARATRKVAYIVRAFQ